MDIIKNVAQPIAGLCPRHWGRFQQLESNAILQRLELGGAAQESALMLTSRENCNE